MAASDSFWILGLFGVLLVVGIPIAIALLVAGVVYLLGHVSSPLSAVASIAFASLDKTAILSVPFFILAAELLNRGGAIRGLVRFVDACIGHWRGGLPLVALVTIVIFSSICGSSVATAAAVGVALLPELDQRGYPKRLGMGLITASGGLGILIPPSIPFIVFGLVTGTSIADLFAAGVVPGLLLAAVIATYIVLTSSSSDVPRKPKASAAERRATLKHAIPVLVLPIVILGSIYGGVFTPSESAAVAVIYALVVTFRSFRQQGMSEFIEALKSSCATSATILFVIMGASVFAYALTDSGAPRHIAEWIFDLELTPIQFLILVNVLLIVLGTVLEVISVMLITLPILMPIVLKLGIDPVHFAVIMVVNMEIAVITPPVGLNLFAISAISKTPIGTVFRSVLPYLALLFGALIAVTYLPQISLFLPRVLRG